MSCFCMCLSRGGSDRLSGDQIEKLVITNKDDLVQSLSLRRQSKAACAVNIRIINDLELLFYLLRL